MASHPARTPLGLFDNPVCVFSLDELAVTVRKRERPGRTAEEPSGSVTSRQIQRARRAPPGPSASFHAAEPVPG